MAEAAAPTRPDGLTAGFDVYRTLPADAEYNEAHRDPVDTPVLYLRGGKEPVEMGEYLEGFRAAGLTNVRPAVVPGSGHFSERDAPEATWAVIRGFIRG